MAARINFVLGVRHLLDRWARIQGVDNSVVIAMHGFHGYWASPENPGGFCTVATPNRFAEQVEYLGRRFEFAEPAAFLEFSDGASGRALITFDDGYVDLLTVAAPVLADHHAPALAFVPTRSVETGELLWFEKVVCFFELSDEHAVTVEGISYRMASKKQRLASQTSLLARLKSLPEEGCQRIADGLWSRLGETERSTVPRLRLNWTEVRRLRDHGISVGSHSHTHPMLGQIPTADVEVELRTAHDILAEKLGQRVDFFAYPNGTPDTFTDSILAIVARFHRMAFTTIPGIAVEAPTPFEVPRVSIRPTDSAAYLDLKINMELFHYLVRREKR